MKDILIAYIILALFGLLMIVTVLLATANRNNSIARIAIGQANFLSDQTLIME